MDPDWNSEGEDDAAIYDLSDDGETAFWDAPEIVDSRLKHAKRHAIYEDYDPDAMQGVREKYKDLDFNALQAKLKEADSKFFGPDEDGPWAMRYYKPMDQMLMDDRTEHNEKLEDQLFRFTRYRAVHLYTQRVMSWRRGGTLQRFNVICVGGNGKGFVGYGMGKHGEVENAEELAFANIRNNIIDVPLFEGRTIANDVEGRHNGTIVKMMRRPRGHGLVCGPAMRYICEAVGLQDISIKIIGNNRPTSMIHATFKAFAQVRSARETALDLGQNYYKMYEPGGHMERPPTTFELKSATERINNHIRNCEFTWNRQKWRLNRAVWSRYDESHVPPPPGEEGRQQRDEIAQETYDGLSHLPGPNYRF
jgi:small subunit ribosomal protein S5